MANKALLKRDIADLGKCVKHWVGVEQGKSHPNPESCPLCKLYWASGCGRCPILADSRRVGCERTPFQAAWDAQQNSYARHRSPTHAQAFAMRAETDYLRRLKRKLQARLRRLA